MAKIKIEFELPFRILSKKNSKQIALAGNGRRYVVSNQSYKDFEQTAVEWVRLAVIPKIKTLPRPPYKASYDIYFKGNLDADLDNLIASINDVMEKAGLITNDKYIREYLTPTRFSNCSPSFVAKVVLEGETDEPKSPTIGAKMLKGAK